MTKGIDTRQRGLDIERNAGDRDHADGRLSLDVRRPMKTEVGGLRVGLLGEECAERAMVECQKRLILEADDERHCLAC